METRKRGFFTEGMKDFSGPKKQKFQCSTPGQIGQYILECLMMLIEVINEGSGAYQF